MEKNIQNCIITFKSDLTYYQKITKLTKEIPNDMDLGKMVRKLIEEHNEKTKKPPFTSDYTQ